MQGSRVNKNSNETPACGVHEEESASVSSVDSAAVLERVGGDRALLAELAKLFHETCPGQLGKLREAIAAGDFLRVEQISRSLRGGLLNLGAGLASQFAAHLEEMGRRETLTGAGAECAALTREIACAQKELSALCPEVRQ